MRRLRVCSVEPVPEGTGQEPGADAVQAADEVPA